MITAHLFAAFTPFQIPLICTTSFKIRLMHGEYGADDIVGPRPRGYRKMSIGGDRKWRAAR